VGSREGLVVGRRGAEDARRMGGRRGQAPITRRWRATIG
jgi:hypothetical protein